MHARIRRTAATDPALLQAWQQLQVHYARHHNSAAFWDAYQAIQDALTRADPQHRIAICNHLASLAERLGVVDHAQLLVTPQPGSFRDDGHTGATAP